MTATHRKVIGLADVGNLGGEHGFAIEAAGQGSRFSRSAKDRAVDDKAARRWLARLRSRARLAVGIHSKFGSTSARSAPLRIRLGARLRQAWRPPPRW